MPSMTTLADRYVATCEAQERAWEPIVSALRTRGVSAAVEQTGGMVFCVIVTGESLGDAGREIAWGISDETWGGSDINGEHVWATDVSSDSEITPDVANRLADAIAASVAEMRGSSS